MLTQRTVVAVGASAGGVEALRMLAGVLPDDLAAPVLVVLHLPRDAPSALPRILNRSGPLPAATALHGEPLWPGRIYVAPADRHLLVIDGRIRLGRGPAENGHRPAIDPTFRSVARACGPYGVAVVLSGARDDGSRGAAAIAARGGSVLVQDPAEAAYASMPQAAIALVPQARTAGAAALGKLISAAAEGTPQQTGPPRDSRAAEDAAATESALWMALRALEEKAAVNRRLAEGRTIQSYRDRFAQVADDADQASAALRQLIARLDDHPL